MPMTFYSHSFYPASSASVLSLISLVFCLLLPVLFSNTFYPFTFLHGQNCVENDIKKKNKRSMKNSHVYISPVLNKIIEDLAPTKKAYCALMGLCACALCVSVCEFLNPGTRF